MNHKIFQWNCRGIKANRNGLLSLVTNLRPAIISLQETSIKANDDIDVKSYENYNHIHNTGHRASGDVSILFRNDIPQSKININTGLQAIAVKVTFHRTISICTLYILPNDTINKKELSNILQQLPTPYILLCDFNCHNTLWSCKSTNQKGRTFENIINNNNLCLLNTQSQILIDPSSTYLTIDLTLCDPLIYP